MSLHDILGVLDDGDEAVVWATFDQAVALAGDEHARLTLVKTIDPGRLMRWFAPAALQAMGIALPDLDFETIAGHTLARVVEFVPAGIPVTTRLLGLPTGRALIDLIGGGRHDAFVATDVLLAHNTRLVRELRRRHIRTVPVSSHPALAACPRDRTPAPPPIHDGIGA
jgi:hypothetical protein